MKRENVKRTSSDSEKYNVILLGIDSASRLNSIRYIRKTRHLLQSIRGAEMRGFTTVGHSTIYALVPMLHGLPLEKLNRDPKKWWLPFDKNIFIWNRYKKAGYTTFFAEDKPEWALFDYQKGGFNTFPTDFFNRHFAVAISKERDSKSIEQFCINDKTETDLILDYHLQFLEANRNHPHFSFIFLTQITHDYAEYAATVDSVIANYIDKLQERNYLENTILFVFGDHGVRYGHIRNSAIGGFEVKLPMMFVVLPPNFRSRFPEKITNFQHNMALLTSPYDIHETLLDIIQLGDSNYTKPNQTRNGLSIFHRIPRNRSCADAVIPNDLCPCRLRKEVSISSDLKHQVESVVIGTINKMLHPYLNVCHQLRLQKISKAFEFRNESSIYAVEIIFRTVPGNAAFQTEIRKTPTEKIYKIYGKITRINKYGHQSYCVKDSFIRNYCYCKVQL